MNWLRRLLRLGQREPAVWPAEPFPKAWLEVLKDAVPFYRRLSPAERATLREMIRRFIFEKQFWGSQDLQATDEMKVVIAAYACLLVLRRPEFDLYPRTREVIVYPYAFGQTVEAIGPDGRRYRIDETYAGQARYRGPVLLAWADVNPATTPHARHNVVIHEFAHQLDFLDGLADGTPPLGQRAALAEWARVFAAEYETLAAAARQGQPTFIDPYGAKNPAEFFAVATEHFFMQPQTLQHRHPALYEQLRRFYQQDPAGWPS